MPAWRLALRLPVALFPDVEDQAGATAAYFWGKGRFLFPETGLAFSWRVGERVDLVLSSEVFFPVYHLWDGENRPALDEAIITTSVGLSFHL